MVSATGGWMLATKTHHAMVDGVGSIDVGHVLLDTERSAARRRGPAPGAERRPPATATIGLPDWLPPVIDAAHAAAGAGRVVVGARRPRRASPTPRSTPRLHPRRLISAGEAAVAMSEVLWKDEILAARPATLNVPIGTYAAVRLGDVRGRSPGVKEVKPRSAGTTSTTSS